MRATIHSSLQGQQQYSREREQSIMMGDDPDDSKPAAKEESSLSSSSSSSLDKRPHVIRSKSVKRYVSKKPAFTLSFENLTVHVPGDRKGCLGCGGPLQTYAQEYLGLSVEQSDPFYALNNVSGFVKTGEMVLVLGAQDSSTSTLIRSLTARLPKSNDLSGSILFNGLPLGQDSWQGWRRLAPYVSSADTTHAAVLTVRETLQFAAQCNAIEGTSNEEIDATVNEIMQALDIAHVADTVVGDENLRGISGGQKRRVTVGEMLMNPQTSFLGMENITDGLSSKDSLNLIQLLEVTCKAFRYSAVISLLQPSDEIVALFDKILVLSPNGQLDYFGPVNDRALLRHVFLGPDADPSMDSGSICDLVLNQSVDATPEKQLEVQKRFIASTAGVEMTKSLAEIRIDACAKPDSSNIHNYLPKTKYATNRQSQFRIIGARRLKLITRNAVTYTRMGIAAVFGVVIGSLFSQLNYDLIGSLSRTGYLFLNCFLVLMLSSAITIPQTFRERVTLYKHRSAEFYSARVAYMTQVALDIPLSIVEAIVISSFSYFWVDLRPEANYFFYFVGVLIGLEFVGQAFGRFLCAVTRKQVYANTLSSVLILVFGTVAGFMPGYKAIPSILQWLSWFTPASYAFEGIMLNEFTGQNLSIAVLTTPEGSTEVGDMSGEQWLDCMSLPRKNFASYQEMKAFDLFMLFFLAVIFDALGCYYTESRRDKFFQQIRRPQRTTGSTSFYGRKGIQGNAQADRTSSALSSSEWPTSLSVENVSYFVPLQSKTKPLRFSLQSILGPCLVRCYGKKEGEVEQDQDDVHELCLLNKVNARFAKGRMTALMGTSGAGKSTFLDVVAGYKTGGRIEGEILIDGVKKDSSVWRNISGYAEQQDILNPYLSTIETLRFTVACRLAADVDKENVVNDVIRLMGLEDYADMVIGREIEDEGLPKHARKRLTIAVQLVSKPRILFCDEPTTGLGTSAANLVTQALRRCTDEMGLITVVTIHQPSKLIWDAFDDLLLLVAGGQTAYMGEMGKGSQSVLDYFQNLSGEAPPPQVNPANYVLSTVGKVDISKVTACFQQCKLREDLLNCILSDKTSGATTDQSVNKIVAEASRGKNAFKDFLLLTKRHWMTQWRNPSYSFMRLVASTLASFYMGLLFEGEKSSLQGAVYSIGAIFFLVFILVIPMQATVVPLVEDRAVLYREATSGMYSRMSYGLGQLAADIPFHVLNALVMFAMFYFQVHFRREGEFMGYFIIMLFLANWVIMSLGQLFALATPNEESANGLAGLSVILSVILMGFLITENAIPSFWSWAYYANLFRYMIQGLVTNELADNEYTLISPTSIEIYNSSEATSAIIFESGTDLSTNSTAIQAANFLGLATLAGSGINYDWANSGVVAVGALLKCMVANTCLVEPLVENFIECNIFKLFGDPPCREEFNRAVETVNVTELAKCVTNVGGTPGTESDLSRTVQVTTPGLPDNFPQVFESAGRGEKLELVLCLMRVLLPDGLVDDIVESLLRLFKALFGIIMAVMDVIENGISLNGNVILFVFGWAEFQDGELEAPFKWHYCLFAVGMFLVAIELFKLVAIRFIVWTKR